MSAAKANRSAQQEAFRVRICDLYDELTISTSRLKTFVELFMHSISEASIVVNADGIEDKDAFFSLDYAMSKVFEDIDKTEEELHQIHEEIKAGTLMVSACGGSQLVIGGAS